MRRVLLMSALLSAGGCTCLFNPDNVKGCDDLPSVEPLEVIAGDGLSLTWQWPSSPGGDAGRVREWELCLGESEDKTDSCHRFPFGYCDSGTCSFTLQGADAGLQYNKRVFGDVLARDFCGMTTPVAKASATPINGSFLDTQGITVNAPCDAGVRVTTPGELVFDMPAPGFGCLATAMMGDEGWLDATMDLEFRLVGSGIGGFGVRAPVGATDMTPRNGIIFSSAAGQQATAYVTRRIGTTDVAVASAIPNVQEAVWNFARVVMKGEWISVSYGPTRETMREVIRYRDPTQSLARGQLGLALVSLFFQPGRIEARNLRVRTGATIPDGGPTRATWAFGIDSLNTVRRVNNAQLGPCPAFPGNAPDAGAQCLEVTGNNAQGTVEVPIGIDVTKRWRVKFRYAADMNGAATNPQILRTTVGTAMDGFAGVPIIDGAGFNWMQPLRAFGKTPDTIEVLTPGQWHTFEVLFDGTNTGYSVTYDGVQKRTGTSGMPQHLGALVLGGGGTHAWFADLEISQDP